MASRRYRELQKTADAAQADLRAEVKVKSFEVDRAQLLKEETTSQMKQLKLQNEMLQAKVKVGPFIETGSYLVCVPSLQNGEVRLCHGSSKRRGIDPFNLALYCSCNRAEH